MRKKLAAVVCFFLAVLLAPGCGTIMNLASDDPMVYGSLAHDPLVNPNADAPHVPLLDNMSGFSASGKGAVVAAAAVLLLVPTIFVADISLDVAGDTVTLPVAYYLNRKARAADNNPDPSSEPKPRSEPPPLVLPTCLLENSGPQPYFGQTPVIDTSTCLQSDSIPLPPITTPKGPAPAPWQISWAEWEPSISDLVPWTPQPESQWSPVPTELLVGILLPNASEFVPAFDDCNSGQRAEGAPTAVPFVALTGLSNPVESSQAIPWTWMEGQKSLNAELTEVAEQTSLFAEQGAAQAIENRKAADTAFFEVH